MEQTPPAAGPEGDRARRKRAADARLKLAFLPRYDALIRSYERLPERADLSNGEIVSWQQRRRREYAEATGVEIEQRDALRARLADVAETGCMTVEDIVAQLQTDFRNGSGVDCSAGDSGTESVDWL